MFQKFLILTKGIDEEVRWKTYIRIDKKGNIRYSGFHLQRIEKRAHQWGKRRKYKTISLIGDSEEGAKWSANIQIREDGKSGEIFLNFQDKDSVTKIRKSHYDENREKMIEYVHRRKRRFGFKKLNHRFPNSHAHHTDINHVIFIPKEIHNSIYHELETGKGMRDIDREAFLWIACQENLPLWNSKDK